MKILLMSALVVLLLPFAVAADFTLKRPGEPERAYAQYSAYRATPSMPVGNHTTSTSVLKRWATLKESEPDSGLKQDYHSTTVAVGYKYTAPSWSAGASLSFEHGTRRFYLADNRWWRSYIQNDKKRSNIAAATIFASLHPASGWYLNFDASAGNQHNSFGYKNDWGYVWDLEKNSLVFAAGLEAGKRFDYKPWGEGDE